MIIIYGLSSSGEPDNIRYIGKTTNTIEDRLRRHLSNYSLVVDTYKDRWIKSEILKGNAILIKPLYIVKENENWKTIEVEWIEKYKIAGYKLTNGTIGGEGVKLTEETEKKRIATRIANNLEDKKEEIEKHEIKKIDNKWVAKRVCPTCSKILIHTAKSFSNIIHLLRKSIKRECLVCRSTGVKLSEEAKKKISTSKKNLTQETRDKFSKLHKGKTVSEEVKEKLRKANIGKKHTKESKEKMSISHMGHPSHNPIAIIQFTKDDIEIKIWENILLAAKTLGLSQGALSNAVNGRTKSCGGFKWKKYI